MTKSRGLSRRNFLIGIGGATLALPYLESFAAPCVPGMPCESPQRFILFHHGQGAVLSDWHPTGNANDFQLSEILSPLSIHKNQCTFVTGLDNVAKDSMAVGNGHVTAERSLYTGVGFADESVEPSELNFGGPSIDHVIAQRIQGKTPLRALNLAVTAGSAGNSYSQSRFLSNGINDPVTSIANPMEVYLKFFAAGQDDIQAATNLLERRISVLDAVLENFNHLKARVSQADKLALDAHATKIYDLEQQLIKLHETQGTCSDTPMPIGPFSYEYWNHAWEPISAGLQMDLMLFALSCGLTNVATLDFDYSNSPSFPWLWNEMGGPLVPTNKYDNWHGMVHTGRNYIGTGEPEPGLVRGYKWYTEMFALLLDKMKAIPDVGGKSLLDTSLVLWGTEYGDGFGHNTRAIPFVLAGTVGSKPMGHWIDHYSAKNDDPTQTNKSGHCVNELYVALLQAFDGQDTTFGNHMTCPTGPLPGILS